MRNALLPRVERLAARGVVPRLAVVVVGDDDAASRSYVNSIARLGAKSGVTVSIEALPSAASQGDATALLQRLGSDESVHGIILQQPLPRQLHADELVESIVCEKDVDGANPATQGHLAVGRGALFTPATPRAVIELLRRSRAWPVLGKHAVVIGKSNVVGMPVALLLMHAGATVTVCHKDTVDLASHVRRAEVLVSAAGAPHLVTAEMLTPGVTVIDVGTTFVDDELRGDVDPEAARALAAEYTPVPGGVGPVTTATLLTNVVDSAERASGVT